MYKKSTYDMYKGLLDLLLYSIYTIVIPIYLSIMKFKYNKMFIGNTNYIIIILLSILLIYCRLNQHKDFMGYGLLKIVLLFVLVICYIVFISYNFNKIKHNTLNNDINKQVNKQTNKLVNKLVNKHTIHYKIIFSMIIVTILIVLVRTKLYY
jgi:hypothetical protein